MREGHHKQLSKQNNINKVTWASTPSKTTVMVSKIRFEFVFFRGIYLTLSPSEACAYVSLKLKKKIIDSVNMTVVRFGA